MLQQQQLYMPQCDEGRFDRQGIAGFFDMPNPQVRRLSPVTHMSIPSCTVHKLPARLQGLSKPHGGKDAKSWRTDSKLVIRAHPKASGDLLGCGRGVDI
jgi:hypothetical protein